jgi:hypothetical protein
MFKLAWEGRCGCSSTPKVAPVTSSTKTAGPLNPCPVLNEAWPDWMKSGDVFQGRARSVDALCHQVRTDFSMRGFVRRSASHGAV